MSKANSVQLQEQSNNSPDENWNLVISSKHKFLDLRIREVIRYRDLIFLLVKRDFTVQYKQTILGPLWYLIQPVISTIMYAFVFGGLANIGTDGIPFLLFYYAGTMLWTYFTGTLNAASTVFINNSNIFGKIYFPRLVVPISTTIGQMIKLGIQFALLIVFYIVYLIKGVPIVPSVFAFMFPLLVCWIGIMGCGFGIVISALTTKYRDLKIVLEYGISLCMYITPVVYPLSQAPEKFKWIFYINPMSAPVELFRVWFYGAGYVPPYMILSSLGITFLAFFFGLLLFNHNERTFVDVI